MLPTIDRFMTRAPYCLGPTDNLARARLLMDRHHIRHLPVVDEDGALVGTVSRRELAVAEAVRGLDPSLITVALAMRPAVTALPSIEIDEAAALMVKNEVDCIVVREEDGTTTGIFTAIDALDAMELATRALREAPLC
jgi:CBS domain-containing protein